MTMELQNALDALAENATKLSFPFMANKSKKEDFLETTKQNIDQEISALLDDPSFFIGQKESLWKQACISAGSEFDTLPDKLQLNSFYLQEVMHKYIELITEYLSEN